MDQSTDAVIAATRALLKSLGYFVDHWWHVRDVHFICEQQELPNISDEEAMEVFAIAREQFDGETGISWPQLESALRVYLKKKALLAAPVIPAPVAP